MTTTHRYRVLLVEDSPDDAFLVTRMLKKHSSIEAEVVHVDRVAAARMRLHHEGFDCILLDLGLPDARGLEALRLIATASPESAIVVLTGLEDEETGIQAVQEGAQDYLAKTAVDEHILARAIRYSVERKRVEATKRHFLDNAAHELRTPLSIIAGAAEILETHRDDIDKPRFEELIAVISKQGRRVSYLLTQLLELSELEEASREGVEVIDLSEFLVDTIDETDVPDEKYVDTAIEEGLKVRAHPERLRHIVTHFLENACRYGGKNIWIESRAQNGRVMVGVTDDGPGISEELRFQLFEPFGRGSLWHPQGSGLGLAICQRMAKSFDAEISYKPGTPVGARFELHLKPV